ncbi:MAG: SurA N-terminal domain-containing protein [Owenweeksia sp.]|nr:SurA N-terminal domain-containing protein [Owenweeksia sp.]
MWIGLAMLGFILTDLLGSGNSILRGDANVVGEVNGTKIQLQEFSDKMKQREQAIRQQNPQQAQFITQKQIADGVWDQILRDHLMQEQYDQLGFKVTGRELLERIKANPNIQQAPAFKDQASGQFSEGRLQQYITQLEQNRDVDEQSRQGYEQWIEFESGVKSQALQTKYNQAIQKGIYVPSAMARELHERNNSQTSANFYCKRVQCYA